MQLIIQALKINLVLMALTGILFPVLVTLGGKLLFPTQAAGSLYYDSKGQVRGSMIIGQSFSSPSYFHGRPSSAGSGYDAANSSGSNLGPTSSKLIEGIEDDPATTEVDESFQGLKQLSKSYRELNLVSDNVKLPADAVTRSASGLDPHISPANAYLQAVRVSKERNINIEKIRSLIQENIEPRFLGIFGEPRVNVMSLNLALEN